MSDSGRQAGDCPHQRRAGWCVDCLREEVGRLREALARSAAPLQVLAALIRDDEYEEMTPDFQRTIVEAAELAAAALAAGPGGGTV